MTIQLIPSAIVATQSPAPIDHAHLSRYTMGNRALELEVLHLFADQAPNTFDELEHASTGKARHMAAHTMKGSARAVGAGRVGKAAEDAEVAGHDHAERHLMLARLRTALDEVKAYIDNLSAVG